MIVLLCVSLLRGGWGRVQSTGINRRERTDWSTRIDWRGSIDGDYCWCNQRLLLIKLLSSIADVDAVAADWYIAVVAASYWSGLIRIDQYGVDEQSMRIIAAALIDLSAAAPQSHCWCWCWCWCSCSRWCCWWIHCFCCCCCYWFGTMKDHRCCWSVLAAAAAAAAVSEAKK